MAARKYIGLVAILILLNGIVYFYYRSNICLTDGSYVYPLDDTYIHLAMAKNIAFHNNWGVVHDTFCSSSSSPVYTFALSVLMRIFGDSDTYPLLVNIFLGNAIIFLLFWFFKRNPVVFLCSCLFLFTPVLLHIQILSGMEHALHIFLMIAAFMLFYKHLEKGRKKHWYLFLAVSALLCLTRYESMFFIVSIVFVLVLNKQYKRAGLTLTVGFLPVLLFGVYSMVMGGFFFPNSLMIKGNISFLSEIFYALKKCFAKTEGSLFHNLLMIKGTISFSGGIFHVLEKCLAKIHFIVPILILLGVTIRDFIAYKQYNLQGIHALVKKRPLILALFITIVLHGFFASFGWLYRYEAYLLSLLYISVVMTMAESFFKKHIPSFLLSLALLLLASSDIIGRFRASDSTIRLAGKNIYDQQIQTSRFLHTYYNETKVMANDIGAITYYTRIDLLDVIGLGSTSVVQNKLVRLGKGGGGHDYIEFTLQYPYNQYRLILIYDSWFGIKSEKDYMRLGWVKAGELKIANNRVCGSDVVSIYTSDAAMVKDLRENLSKFKSTVPDDVVVTVFEGDN